MTWTGQSFTVGQVLTAAQMNNLQADITALANGDSGAPEIIRAALKTNTGTTAGTLSSFSKVNITLNAYSFFPMIHITGVTDYNTSVGGHSTDGADPDAPRFALNNIGETTQTYDIDHRYVSA